MLGEQFPPVCAADSEKIREIITTAPLNKSVVLRLGRDCVVDCLRTQLRQMREAAGPAERDLPTIRITPIAFALAAPEKVALEPLRVVAVGADETHGAACIAQWFESNFFR